MHVCMHVLIAITLVLAPFPDHHHLSPSARSYDLTFMATITLLFFLDLPCKYISLNAIVSFGLHINGIIRYALYTFFLGRQVESEVRGRCWPSPAGPPAYPLLGHCVSWWPGEQAEGCVL